MAELDESEIPEHHAFFHKFYTMQAKREGRKQRRKVVPEGDEFEDLDEEDGISLDEDVYEDEREREKRRRKRQREEEQAKEFDYDDMDDLLGAGDDAVGEGDEEDEEDEEDEVDEDEEDEEDEEEEGGGMEGVDLIRLEGDNDDEDDLGLDSDGDAEEEVSGGGGVQYVDFDNGDAGVGNRKNNRSMDVGIKVKRKSGKKQKREKGVSPFASFEEYADMIES